MRVLLTGGAGYIGSHIIAELYKAGHTAVVVDNFSNSNVDAVENVEKLVGDKIPFVFADIRNVAEAVMRRFRPDLVIHLAGYKSVGESMNNPLEYYRNNLGSLMAVLYGMEKVGCKKLIFSSSATVYGEAEEMPISENSVKKPCLNPYGASKSAIEEMLFGFSAARPDYGIVMLRYFNPVGAHRSGIIGENPSSEPSNLMPLIVNTACGKREKLTIFGDDYPTPDGTCVRDYIHVVDLARGHVAALEGMRSFEGIEVFNLGTGRGVSVKEIIETFIRVNGVNVKTEIGERRKGDVAVCYCNPEKAQRMLNWKAELTLEDMCKDSWNYYQNFN